MTRHKREFTDIDIRDTTLYDDLATYVMEIWQTGWGLLFVDERGSANHAHLANQPARRRAAPDRPRPLVGASAAICAVLSCTAPAQEQLLHSSAGSDTVAVRVDSVWRELDRITVAYRVVLGQAWQGRLYAVVIEPGVPLGAIGTGAPDRWLDQKATYEGRDVIEWNAFAAEDRPAANDTIVGFVIRAPAILGTVPFLAQAYEPPALTSEDQLGDTIPVTSFWSRGSAGTILGPVAPLPAGSSARGARLAEDVSEWCAGANSVPRGICESLTRKASEVRDAAASNAPETIDRATRVLRAELDAQRGKHLPEGVYWRLLADLLMVAP